jgi:golgin subfamily B member 1
MTPEIARSLSTLSDNPSDPQALAELQARVPEGAPLAAEDAAILAAAMEHHRGQGNFDTLLILCDLLLRGTSDAGRRIELLRQKARILEEDLLEEGAALEALRQILAIAPDDPDALAQLEQIELVRGSWERVASKYAEEASEATERQLATRLFLSAAKVIWRNEPASPKVEEYLRRSLEVEPRNWQASGHLERLLRRTGRYRELAALLDQRADVAPTREERVAALLAAGRVFATELSNPEEASNHYKRAVGLDPGSETALRFLVETLTRAEDWPAIIRVYEEVLRARPRPDQEPAILVQIGMLYDRKLGRQEKAEECFRKVRKVEPGQPLMLAFYRGYYRSRGEGQKLLALFDAAQRGETDPAKRLELSREMADVAEKEVGNLEKAIDIWKGLQRMDPKSPEALGALKRLYRQSQPPKWNALRELLKDELESLEAARVDDKIRLLLEVVEIYRDHLKLDVMVVNTYNAILALRPDHPEALAALSEKFESMGRWNDLIGLLLRRKDALEDPAEKAKTLHRVASLWIEKFGNQSQALKPLEEILRIDPGDAVALQKLRDIHTKRHNWRELIELARKEAVTAEGDRRRALYREMAGLAADKLGDPREGIQVWNMVLEENPRDPEALSELAGLYRREERWPALAEILHRQVEASREDAVASVALLESLGEIYTNRLRAVESAIQVWQEVLEVKPDAQKARAVLRELYVQQGRFDDLEKLFAARGDWSELAETLTAAADRSALAPLKIRLYSRVGEICRDRLSSPERAIKAYERVMAIDAESEPGARALVPLYEATEKWGRLLSMHEILLEHATTSEEKLPILAEIRRLCEVRLGSKNIAFQWCSRAFALAPQDAALREELERLAAESDAWEELVSIYTDQMAEIAEEAPRSFLLRRIAALVIERLHRPEDAEVFLVELLELHPDDRNALEALEKIYDESQRWADLVGICQRRAALEAPVEARLEDLTRVARIQEERLGDPSAAIETLRRIVELRPDHLDALQGLERLHQVRGEWDSLVEVLRRELDLVTGADARIEILFTLGETLKDRLSNDEGAINTFAAVLALSPSHHAAVQALESYLDAPTERRASVARLLLPVYERSEAFAKVVRVLEILLELEKDRAERLAMLGRMMRIQVDRLKSGAAAFDLGKRILSLDPEDGATRAEMSQIAESLGRLDELAGILEATLSKLGEGANPALELALSFELATLYDDRLEKHAEAEPHLARVLALDPDHAEAMATLERILRDGGKWRELRDLLGRRKEMARDAGTRRDILLQICSLNEDFLDDTAAAIRAYEEILEIEPDHGVAIRALERHYAETGRFRDLLDLLRREMGFATEDRAISELKYRQAELLAGRLGEPTAALDLLEEIVNVDPGLERAVRLVESLLETEDLRRRVTEILEAVYQRREDWTRLVQILLTRRSFTTDRFEAVELLCRAAALKEDQLADQRGAFECYREAIVLEPGAGHIHEAVARLAEVLGAFEEVAATWQAAFDASDPSDLALRSRLKMRLARVLEEKLTDLERARGAYEQLLEIDPSDLETVKPATAALCRIYEAQGAFAELIAAIRRQLGWEEDPASRGELLLKIARIQEEVLGETESAVATFAALLEESPSSPDALDSLERLFLQGERWADLVGICRRRVELAGSTEERRGLVLRIAVLYEEELADQEQAVSSYIAILDESPQDLEAIRALSRIYRTAERYPELFEMLDRELALVPEEARVDLLFQMATLQHRHLGGAPASIDFYRQILDRDRAHEGTRAALDELLLDPDLKLVVAELLAPLFEAEGRWERLIAILELQAEGAAPAPKIQLLSRITELFEVGLDDLGHALDTARRILVEAVAEPGLLDHVEKYLRLARTLERWGDLVDLLERIVPDVMDGDAKLRIHLLCAETSRDHLGDLERARRHYREVLDADAQHRGAIAALDAIYETLEQWEPLLETILLGAELAGDDAERVGFVLRGAKLCRTKLQRPEEAIAHFERALALDPRCGAAIAALDELYAQTERWSDLAELLMRRISDAEDPRSRVELWWRLGRLRAERQSDPMRALEAYREVLALEPTHPEVVASLEATLDDPDLQVEAAGLLEPLYVGRQDWPQLIRIYQIRLEAAPDPERRLTLSTRIAQLYEEQLEDLEGAFTWYGRVFLEKPSDVGIREQLLRLAGILDRWEELAQVFEKCFDQSVVDEETSRAVALLLGAIYDERLGKVDESSKSFKRALEADRGDKEAFNLLESLLTRFERWEELLQVYQDMADATVDAETKRDLLVRICRVQEEALFRIPEAIEAYRAVLDLVPDDREAIPALERLYTESARWQDLCDLLQMEADLPDKDEDQRITFLFRIGSVYELRLQNLEAAIDYYEEVLKREANHIGAISALERLVLDRDQRFRISQILEGIYSAQDEWAKLVVIYDAQLEFIEERDKRISLLKEIARLHEERPGGSYELAFRATARALEEDFGDPGLLEHLEKLSGRINNWPELVTVLKKGVEGIFDYDVQAKIHAKIARLQEERLGDRAAAVESWRKVLSARETDEEAITVLVRLLEALDRNEELIEVLRRKTEITLDPEIQKKTYFRIAEIYEVLLVLPEKAVETYRQILSIDDSDLPALTALERLYLMASNWLELIWVYRRKIELATDETERRSLLLSVARVYEERLEDSFEAIASYKTLLEEDTTSLPILDALDRLFSKEARFSDLLEILELKIAQESGTGARIALIHRAGQVLEEEIGDLDGAVERYRQVLEEEPSHEQARGALERLVQGDSHREVVAEILEQLYTRLGEVGPLVGVLELRIEIVADPPTRRDLLVRIGRLDEEGIQDLRAAFSAYARALAEDPSDESVQADLERLASALGIFAELVQVYEAQIEAVYDPGLSRRLNLKVAALFEEVIKDDGRAEERYRAALSNEGDPLPPLVALDRILLRREKWPELLEVLEREVQAVTDPNEQAELFNRIGEIRIRSGEDLDGAFAAFRDSLDRNPGHRGAREGMEKLLGSETYRVPVLDVLEPIYEGSGEHAKVSDLLETRLTTVVDPQERTSILERIAKIHEEKLHAKGPALGALERALAEEPSDETILSEVERLATELGKWAEITTVAEEILDKQASGDAVRTLGLRLADWWSTRQNDVAKAEACLRRVLDADPECKPAMDHLEMIYRASAELTPLAALLWRRAEVEMDTVHKRALLAEVARIRQDIQVDTGGAIEAWRAILEIDQSDVEALDALGALYQLAERWDDFLEILEAKSQLASDHAEQVRLKLQAGEILDEKLGQLDRAIETYRDTLDLDPRNAMAIERLEVIFEKKEDWQALLEVLLRRLEAAGEAGRVAVLMKLADLSAKELQRVEDAVDYYHQILTLQPGCLEAFDRMEVLLRSTGRWYDLVEILRKHADAFAAEGNEASQVAKLVAAAQVWNDELDNSDSSAEILEEILRQDPKNASALNGLARIYEKTEQWDRCSEILLKVASLNPSPKERAELEFRLGRVQLAQKGDEESAVGHFKRAIDLDPDHEEAAKSLEAHGRKKGEWDLVAEMLQLRVGHAPKEAQLAMLGELARIFAEELSRPDDCVAALELARELSPDNPEVLGPLTDAYYAAGQYDMAEPLLQALIGQTVQGKRKELAKYTFRMGTIQEARGVLAAAKESYDKAYRLDSTHGPTLVALGRLYMIEKDFQNARRIYRTMLLQNMDERSGIAKADVFLNLGLAHMALGEKAKALSMFERGVELAPESEELKKNLLAAKT